MEDVLFKETEVFTHEMMPCLEFKMSSDETVRDLDSVGRELLRIGCGCFNTRLHLLVLVFSVPHPLKLILGESLLFGLGVARE